MAYTADVFGKAAERQGFMSYVLKDRLLACKSLPFTGQKLISWKVKAYLLQSINL